MRTLPKFLAALAFLSSAAPAFAEAGAFAEWLSGDQPECIPLGAVTKAADDSVPLNGDQFLIIQVGKGRGRPGRTALMKIEVHPNDRAD